MPVFQRKSFLFYVCSGENLGIPWRTTDGPSFCLGGAVGASQEKSRTRRLIPFLCCFSPGLKNREAPWPLLPTRALARPVKRRTRLTPRFFSSWPASFRTRPSRPFSPPPRRQLTSSRRLNNKTNRNSPSRPVLQRRGPSARWRLCSATSPSPPSTRC